MPVPGPQAQRLNDPDRGHRRDRWTNSTELVDYVQTTFNRYRQIVLDLSRVDFFDESGYSCIGPSTPGVRTAGSASWWSPAPMSNALEDHPPDCTVATAANIVSAVATLARTGRSPAVVGQEVRTVTAGD